MSLNNMKVLVSLLVACCLQVSLACYCSLDHPQKKFCNAAFVIRGRIISKEDVYPHVDPTTEAPISESTPPTVNFAEHLVLGGSSISSSKRIIAVKYIVRVEKIYKGEDLMTDKKVEIITPPTGSLCGVTDLEIEGVYLLSGRKWEDDLRIELCGWIAKYDDITKRQRQGIKNNYKDNCDACQIQLCYGAYCPRTAQQGLCMWDSSGMYEDCESKYAYCKENKKGKCIWNGKTDYKTCKTTRDTERDARLP